MTKKKIAHPKRATKRTPTDARKRRQRAIAAEPLLDERELARMVKRLRAAGVEAESTAWLLVTRGKQLRKMAEELAPGVVNEVTERRPPENPLPEGEVERAAARAGIPSFLGPDDPPATALAYLKNSLVRATDLVGESLASVEDQSARNSFDCDGIRNNLSDVLVTLWRIRWECYAMAGDVGVKEEQTAGGASS